MSSFDFVSAIPPRSAESPRDAVHWQARQIPLSHGRHCPGQLTLAPRPCTVPFESLLERDAIAFLSARSGFRFISSQPFTIEFAVGAALRRYTPDLLVVFDPVSTALKPLGFRNWTIVEVKPASKARVEAEAIQARLHQVTRLTGLAGVCLTEEMIARGGHKP